MQPTRHLPLLHRFHCIACAFLILLLPAALLAQQNKPETRTPPTTRFALESAAGLGVWAGAAAAGGLLVWGMSYADCPDDPDAPHACPAATLATFGVLLLAGAAMVLTPIAVKYVGNKNGTFGNALIAGLVGLASFAVVGQLYPHIGLPASLALIPVANILGNVITFELTHTPPPKPLAGITNTTDFQLQPGLSLKFRF